MSAPLPHIARKHFKPNGRVDLWDVVIEDGPVKLEFTSILAREALQRDPKRFCLVLPKGMKPGKLQDDADERARLDAQTAAEIEASDPAYGRSQA